ncbi:MAG TPA: type II toxin-antitoxin system Phd/YefM family antitoxin [Firmicutes bacterium]|nr:type II toxin-antitoxin system Phd/YefM family antitoxin [Bacillota bacterium]
MESTKGTLIITATELKKNLGKYLKYVMENNEVVVTKNGRKEIRITPYIDDFEQYLLLRERATDYLFNGKRVSYEEFMQIYNQSDLRMEYINGEMVLLSSPDLAHQETVGNLLVLLREFFTGGPCKVYSAPLDVHFWKKGFKDPDVMQPDLIVACDTGKAVDEKGRYMGTPALVVEVVSEATRSKDMVIKLNTYMLSGVKEYWVIDPRKKAALVYTFIYESIDKFESLTVADTLSSSAFPGLRVKLSAVLAGS